MTRILCFGEILLRLSAPGRQRLLQSPRLDVFYGGAEANVAVALAHLGYDSAMASFLPDTAVGRAGRAELARFGVSIDQVMLSPGRMGLYYYERGAMNRRPAVIYDRGGSAFQLALLGERDWSPLLAGVDWLHVSGVTAALGPGCARALGCLVRQARARGLTVSLDINYRAALWAGWRNNPARVLGDLIAEADMLFASARDSAIFGDAPAGELPARRRFEQMARLFHERFPGLRLIAGTERQAHSAERNSLAAFLMRKEAPIVEAGPVMLENIVDRIGGGDAFAAGIIAGDLESWSDAHTLAFALSAAGLKHGVPGDFARFSRSEVEAALSDAEGGDIRR